MRSTQPVRLPYASAGFGGADECVPLQHHYKRKGAPRLGRGAPVNLELTYAPAPAARTIGSGRMLSAIWLKYTRYER